MHLGYQAERLPRVAPGQVLHLTLHGLTTIFQATQVATTIPLPTEFNGLSISLQQSGTAEPIPLPLLRGLETGSCSGIIPVSVLGGAVSCAEDPTYDLWVQIPFELKPNDPATVNGPCTTTPCVLNGITDAVLTVKEKSGQGMNLRVLPVIDQVHLLNTCTDNVDGLGFVSLSQYLSMPCTPAIAHNDNSWVSATNPARPGEVLIAYAFGLGAPATSFPTASGTPKGGVPVNRPITVSFTGAATQPGTAPDYVGLVGGNAGLYQINFRVPAVPATLPPCTASSNYNFTQLPATSSNLTMTLTGTSSLDQASFCVQP